jgi:hypothetical protein
MHAPYVLFQKQAKNFNGGRKIRLIRAADTRMAGYFMVLHRMLRLKNVLCATIVSAEYKNIKWTKTSTPTKMEAFIEDKEAWYAIYAVLRCVYPALRVLRLANKATAGMDMLLYFVRKTDQALELSLESLHGLEYFKRQGVKDADEVVATSDIDNDDDDAIGDNVNDNDSDSNDDDDDDADDSSDDDSDDDSDDNDENPTPPQPEI